jgi:ribulose-5-phosphate 4-epimerase/fuculose-1-phosphate aldolase
LRWPTTPNSGGPRGLCLLGATSARSLAAWPAQWAARVQLAAAYRIFAHLGWEELIYNHLSLRVPGEPGHFLLNPFGLHYTEVCASNLVKVDGDGHTIGSSRWPINPAGFTFHGAIHRTLPDAHCVMHVHTTPTMAVCCLDDGLSYTNFYAAQLYGKVAYHDFEGITVHADEGARILASAGAPHDCKPVLTRAASRAKREASLASLHRPASSDVRCPALVTALVSRVAC